MKHRAILLVPFIAILFALSALAAPVCEIKEESKPFTFVVMGDSQALSGRYSPPPVFYEITADIAKLKPAFILHTGDFVQGWGDMKKLKRQYWEFVKVMNRTGVPYYLALGNHNGGSPEAHALFEGLWHKTYYSFDHCNSHFLILDSTPGGEAHRISDEEFAWLKKDLEAANGKYDHIFAAAHDPLYPVGIHTGTSLDKYPERRDKLAALFRKYGVVYFAGHEHLFDHSVFNGVTQVITGGAGAGVVPSRKGVMGFHHFVIITVNGRSAKISVARPGSEPSVAVDLVPKR